MIGYWLVMALVAFAIVAVVAAAAGLGDEPSRPARRSPLVAVQGASDAVSEGTPNRESGITGSPASRRARYPGSRFATSPSAEAP